MWGGGGGAVKQTRQVKQLCTLNTLRGILQREKLNEVLARFLLVNSRRNPRTDPTVTAINSGVSEGGSDTPTMWQQQTHIIAKRGQDN